MTRHNFRGWLCPTQGVGHPRSLEAYPFLCKNCWNLIHWVVRVRPSICIVHPQGIRTRKVKFFTCIISIFQPFGQVLHYLPGWVDNKQASPHSSGGGLCRGYTIYHWLYICWLSIGIDHVLCKAAVLSVELTGSLLCCCEVNSVSCLWSDAV